MKVIQTDDQLARLFCRYRAVKARMRQTVRSGQENAYGADKTTLVRILATLLRPDAGRAQVGGFDVARQPGKVRELIALTGQFAAVDEDLTGGENLLLIARLLELSRKVARTRADELLERFGLAEAGGRLAKTYSGGMRRRLDLAMGLAGEPRVLFLDEPTTGLDPRSRGDVWDMIRDLVAAGTTVLLTTQDLDEADRLAGRIAVIDRGRLIASGTPAELKAKVGGQSLTGVSNAARGLLLSLPLGGAPAVSLLWALGIVAVFAPLATWAYRRQQG